MTDVSGNWTAASSDIIPDLGDYVNLADSSGFFHATWADGRFGDPDVFYAAEAHPQQLTSFRPTGHKRPKSP